MPEPHGWQQSDVTEHPNWKNGMQGIVVVVVVTHTPVTSGLLCRQTSPGAQTGGGGKMFPPQGPPTRETHPQAAAPGRLSQLAPEGQLPPQAPEASLPHGLTQRAAGPGQQVSPPAVAQIHPCSHTPLWQMSAVHGLPSLQSLFLWQVGCVVLVVVVTVIVVVERQRGLQNSFGSRHGLSSEQGWSLHCRSIVMKHRPVGGGHSARQNSFGGHGVPGAQDWPVHRWSSASKHIPVGGGGGQTGTQNSFGRGHRWPAEQDWPVHWC